ncbi:MAG: hypothetical protein D6797_06765 [Bdellovibrio sp.]|nr:MAG: hypothetical protein D6797_06765 [Bdellovibrio sp.]
MKIITLFLIFIMIGCGPNTPEPIGGHKKPQNKSFSLTNQEKQSILALNGLGKRVFLLRFSQILSKHPHLKEFSEKEVFSYLDQVFQIQCKRRCKIQTKKL